jgi:hypothetical protein
VQNSRGDGHCGFWERINDMAQARLGWMLAAAALLTLTACASPVPVGEHHEQFGVVFAKDVGRPTGRRPEPGQREFAESMYGPLGSAVVGLMFPTRQGAIHYYIRRSDGVELSVVSDHDIRENECVVIRYPAALEERRYFELGEADLAVSKRCPQAMPPT